MKKRILSIALVLCMLLSVVPLTPIAVAATTGTTTTEKDITLGYSALHDADTEGAKWDYVYFGTYNSNPIKWRVLSMDGNSTTTGTGTTDVATYKTAGDTAYTGEALFMLSENTLGSYTLFCNNNKYQGSDLQTAMKGIFPSDSKELKYVLKTTKTDSSETIGYINPYDNNYQYSITWGESNLSDDTLFALSAREVEQYLGSGEKCANKKSGDAKGWWLRSPDADRTGIAGFFDGAGFVRDDGCVDCSDVDFGAGARPALNLNSSKILFTSAAVGGKVSDTDEGQLTENMNYADIADPDGYKLTLLDESRNGFSARLKSISGNTVTVAYSGAKTGVNEYISVIIRNGDTVKYYGRVASTYAASYASGEADIFLPRDFSTANGDVLCVFNEQYNGNNNTDYASDLVVLPDYRWYTADTDADVYTISTVSEFLGFANLVNGTNLPDGVSGNVNFSGKIVKLLNDLDLSCISNWTPIGNLDSDIEFKGIFEGDGHTISNLSVNSSGNYAGLFGYCYDAKIRNLAVFGNVTRTLTSDKGSTGGILAIATSTAVENCSFTGSVTGNGTYVGGLIGSGSVITISKCFSNATVSGNASYLGGIIGGMTWGNIQYCYNQGDVISTGIGVNAGGIIGDVIVRDYKNGERVRSVYNTGSVSIKESAGCCGGIIGCLYHEVARDLYIDGVYYLESGDLNGIGDNHGETIHGEVKSASADEFGSGEIAKQLQDAVLEGDGQVWGQTIGKDAYPVFANESGSNTVCEVTFKVDGEGDQVKYVNKGGTVSIEDPTAPTGYHFDGWYTAQEGGTKFDLSSAITADTTLYARFALNTYTVSYNAGANGTGTIAAGSKTHGTDFTLSSETFTCAGYTQTGWATTDGGEKVYDLGGKYTDNVAVTLYPVWTVNQYTVTVKPENGETDITITQDYGTTVTAPTLTRDGYAFDGWDKTFPTTMPAGSMTITAKWKDITAPTGEIKLGSNSWKTFLNSITFGLFFNDTQEIEITATDNSGEDVTVEYLLSDKELSEAELATATFTAYTGKFTVEPNNEYVIYAKLTDKAGNATYINSNGIVLDNVKPVISGIEDGKTYCAAQTVTVSDKYEVTVTVNGNPVTPDTNGQFTLSAAEGAQKIVVTDKAGNKSEMTVTVNDGHTGGIADCTHKAKCEVCGEEYGEVNADNHTDEKEWSIKNEIQHEQIWKCCGAVTVALENHEWKDGVCAECGYVCLHTGGTATCTDKAICEACGEEYGEVNADNHTQLTHTEAKAATVEAEGNTEYWHCEECGKYFSDKEGKTEITLADTVIAKLEKEEIVPDKKDEAEAPQTGYKSHAVFWTSLLIISGITAVGMILSCKKKKRFSK